MVEERGSKCMVCRESERWEVVRCVRGREAPTKKCPRDVHERCEVVPKCK